MDSMTCISLRWRLIMTWAERGASTRHCKRTTLTLLYCLRLGSQRYLQPWLDTPLSLVTPFFRSFSVYVLTCISIVPLGFYPANVTVESAGPLTVYPAPNVPFGISFFASAFSEFELVGLAFAYEQATQTRLAKRAFDEAIPKTQLSDIVHVCMRGKN